jgi:hypothetical protein
MRHAPSANIDGRPAPTRVATRTAEPPERAPDVLAGSSGRGTGANVCVRGMIGNATGVDVFMGRPSAGASSQVSAASRW